MASITTLLAPCGISHISGMIRPVWLHYWHRVTFPTLVAWYGQYYHITGTVWHIPHKWHDTASMTTLLAPCDHSHISGMVQSLLPHYWHRVAFPTIVAWHGKYDHITGIMWPFPHKWHDTASITTLLAPCAISHISGLIRPVWPNYWHSVTFPTLMASYIQYYHITGTVWHFPH